MLVEVPQQNPRTLQNATLHSEKSGGPSLPRRLSYPRPSAGQRGKRILRAGRPQGLRARPKIDAKPSWRTGLVEGGATTGAKIFDAGGGRRLSGRLWGRSYHDRCNSLRGSEQA